MAAVAGTGAAAVFAHRPTEFLHEPHENRRPTPVPCLPRYRGFEPGPGRAAVMSNEPGASEEQ